MKRERRQTYNVIFIWDKRPNLNPKTLNLCLLYIDFNMVDLNLIIKDHIHGLATKLSWGNNNFYNIKGKMI
jgi:hypothetical protein